MTINDGARILFADQLSDSLGLKLASAVGSTTRSGNSEDRKVITSKNTLTNRFDLHGVTYENSLSLDLILYKEDGTYIDAYEERSIKKWLMKNKYNWLQIDQSDLSSTFYYVICNSVSLIDIGVFTGAVLCKFQCDSPWAWSDLYEYTYSSITTNSFDLYTDIDFDEYVIYPQLIFRPNASGTISLKNTTTNEQISFTGCTTGEEIILECESDKLSATGTNIVSRWNKKTLGIIENINEFEMTGSYSVDIKYRLPVRVGA